MTIIIHVKSFLERHFWGISINSFREKTYFYVKSCPAYKDFDTLQS